MFAHLVHLVALWTAIFGMLASPSYITTFNCSYHEVKCCNALYNRLRGRTLGRSLPVLNFFSAPPGVKHTRVIGQSRNSVVKGISEPCLGQKSSVHNGYSHRTTDHMGGKQTFWLASLVNRRWGDVTHVYCNDIIFFRTLDENCDIFKGSWLSI